MIKTPTVLVLGAGASVPYSFPSGEDLKAQICKGLAPSKISPESPYACVFSFGQSEDIREFAIRLRRSGTESVDEFRRHQPRFAAIGKAAIAAALVPKEQPDALFSEPRPEQQWYHYLLTLLGRDWDQFGRNAVKVVTFNYDRSLEEFLLTAMRNTHGRDGDAAAKKVQEIPIIHVHGSLGGFPWPPGRRYGAPHVTEEVIAQAVRAITLVYEDGNEEAYTQARQAIADAKEVVFLGFGYHQPNLERLGISAGRHNSPELMCYGTGYGLGAMERQYAVNTWAIDVAPPGDDILSYLKNRHRLA